MENVPLEVLENLCKFLTPQDLAACCATSIGWRDAFNVDILWKKKCQQAHLAEDLKHATARVEPKFTVPETEGSSLSPVSEWRLNFMRENHLFNNWRTGNSVQDVIEVEEALHHKFIYNNHILVLTKIRALLYDLSVSPPQCLGEPFKWEDPVCGTEGILCETFGDGKFLIKHKNIVEVYSIGSPVNSVWSLDFTIEEDISEVHRSRNLYCDCAIVNDLIVCSSGFNIYIHRLSNGELVHKEKLSSTYSGELWHYFLRKGKQSPYVIVGNNCIKSRSEKVDSFNYYVYNIASLEFHPFEVHYKGKECYLILDKHCVVLNNVVVIYHNRYLRFYDLESSQLLAKYLTIDCKEVVDNCIYFSNDNDVLQFNTVSQSVKLWIPKIEFVGLIDRIRILCERFLFVHIRYGNEKAWELQKIFVDSNRTPEYLNKQLQLRGCFKNKPDPVSFVNSSNKDFNQSFTKATRFEEEIFLDSDTECNVLMNYKIENFW